MIHSCFVKRRLKTVRHILYCSVVIFSIAALLPTFANGHRSITVAAASSIRLPLDIIVQGFQSQTGMSVKVSYGSSGTLTHQILRGAPYQLFLSADRLFPRRLLTAGRVQAGPIEYARGKLVLYIPDRSTLKPGIGFEDIRLQLSNGQIQHLGIANPELAPYGRAAKQALENTGLWQAVEPILARGNNVSQAANFAFTNNVDASLISESLALDERMRARGSYTIIPAELYDPLVHTMVLLDSGHAGVKALFEFLGTAEALKVFSTHGFQSIP